MPTMSRRLEIIIADTGVMEFERIIPADSEETLVTGQVARLTLNLPAGITVTPNIGNVLPKRWFVMCVHASASAVVSFGTDRFTLEPKEWNYYSNSGTPTFEALSTDSKVFFAAIEG